MSEVMARLERVVERGHSFTRNGYGISWLKRVFDQFPHKVHLLDTQYRMDRAILDFPNKKFYNRRINSGDNVVGREPHVSTPIQFIDTKGRGREEKHQFSWKNETKLSW
jgi:superfamily I DNA and/or RNA helicase